jgi:hypothetical protein
MRSVKDERRKLKPFFCKAHPTTSAKLFFSYLLENDFAHFSEAGRLVQLRFTRSEHHHRLNGFVGLTSINY